MYAELLIPIINASGIARVTGFSPKLSECRQTLASDCPDILLLDINMTDGDGLTFCTEIHGLYPQLKIIALTGHTEYSIAMHMLKNGASGYIIKSEAVNEISEAIPAVMHGDVYLSLQIRQISDKIAKASLFLTPREKQVLQMIAGGMSNQQIAGRLNTGLSDVCLFQKKLCLKLNASNSAELIANARKEGGLIE
jgi:DNA-binding NarL/FixJ family response regulator